MMPNYRVSAPGLLITVLIMLMVAGLATSTNGDYKVNVTGDTVAVRIAGDLVQAVPNISANNTAASFGTLPAFAVHLTSDNSSLLLTALNKALRARAPSASATQLTLDSISINSSYHYNLAFDVAGVSTTRGDAVTIDLSWRSFVISDDIKVENRSLNAVLPTYLLNGISLRAQLPPNSGPPLVIQRFWYLNNLGILSGAVVPSAQSLVLLNFTGLSTPLQKWKATPNIAGYTVRYKTETGFNLTFIERAIEPEGSTNFARDAIYKMTATVEVPWSAVASTDTVILDSTANFSPWLMSALIGSSVALLALTVIVEKRLKGPQKGSKTRRPR